MDLIGIAHCVINQVESVVRPVTLLLDYGNVFSQRLLGVLELMLQPFDILLMHYLLIRLFKRNFASEILHLAVSIRFDPRDLLLFPGSPDFVQITEKGVHQSLGDIRSAPVAEVVRHTVCLIWDPLITILVPKALTCVSITRLPILLPRILVRRWCFISRLVCVHISHTCPRVDRKLRKILILRRF